MKHDFEQLGEDRFQQFCQSLLLAEFPDLACLPVGMPDGGRDGVFGRLSGGGEQPAAQILQVKYVERPDYLDDPSDWARNTIEGELKKIRRLAEDGVSRYWLATNVPASSHLDSGSFDKVQRVLDELLPLPGQCLWRADLDRRLENRWSLKWSYPDLMTGTDFVRALVEGRLSEHAERRTRAFQAFLADEYKHDREVRFKQADVNDELLDAFVDVPAEALAGAEYGHFGLLRAHIDHLARPQGGRHSPRPRRASVGGSSLLLHRDIQDDTPRLVIEGAPGQGKSTLVQYVCQVHRMRLLGRASDVERLPAAHQNSPLRLPFKVDLRQLAQWLSGKSPFGADAPPPDHDERTLEGLLAALVRRGCGGGDFSVADLHALLATGPALIALDGLDEVVDIGDRGEIVTDIERAVERLSSISDSLQVVVTSRPASFTAARLPASTFDYLRLAALTPDLIYQYRDQWASARDLQEQEADELAGVLHEKLQHPHFRDLARNPMQLAILLSLMHRKGPALPDQRTELYQSYMEHFLDREAAKSTAVRDHRQALLLLHGHLAWTLHAEAEKSPRSGRRMEKDELLATSQAFLETQDCGPEVFGDLSGRAIDRFGALVSRIDGTYEFEVQPLQEYFAAFYLYNTAPHSRPGRERSGTLIQRFDALVRRPFWLNVVRFYAGFYGAGELSSLADGLEDLTADPLFTTTALPRTVTAQLLSDRTFTQAPRARSRAIALVTAGVGSRHVGSGEGAHFRGYLDQQQFQLPDRNGAEELLAAALNALKAGMPGSRAHLVARLARRNGTAANIATSWLETAKELSGDRLDEWFAVARHLDLLACVSDDDLGLLLEGLSPSDEKCHALIACGAWTRFDADPAWAKAAEDYILSGQEVWLPLQQEGPLHPLLALGRVAQADREVEHAELPLYSPRPAEWALSEDAWPAHYSDVKRLTDTYDGILPGTVARWTRHVELWDTLVEQGRRIYGERYAWDRLAVIASGIRDRENRGAKHGDLHDESRSLCSRTRFARHRGTAIEWWRSVLDSDTRSDQLLSIALWACWADASVIRDTTDAVDPLLRSLDRDDMQWLLDTVGATRMMFQNTGRASRLLREVFTDGTPDPRTLVMLLPRLAREERQWAYVEAMRAIDEQSAVLIPSLLLADVGAAARSPDRWDTHLRVLSVAEAAGLSAFPPLLGRLGVRGLPGEVARQVVDSASSYPLELVGFSEQTLLWTATKQTPAVGAVAKADEWFASEI